MKMAGPFPTIPVVIVCLFGAAFTSASAQDAPRQVDRKPNLTSDRYEINQTFDGQSFHKDNNIWVYNDRFAETFGMPAGGIDVQLEGIEAAAFRVEDAGYRLCGMGRKVEQCMKVERCMLDVYVDERKHPLPWVNPQQKADWHWRYNSSLFLRTPTEKDGIPLKATAEFIPNESLNWTSTLRPFADAATRKEAAYFENSRNAREDGHGGNFVPVFGYKRQAIAGLTLVSLSQGCGMPNDPRKSTPLTFRLESRDSMTGPTLTRFHEFVLPAAFNIRIQEALLAVKEANAQYFRNLLQRRSASEAK